MDGTPTRTSLPATDATGADRPPGRAARPPGRAARPPGRAGGPPGPARRRPPATRRTLAWLAAVAALVVVVLAAAAILPGAHGSGTAPFGVARIAHVDTSANPLGVRQSRVFGSSIPASRYGTIIGDQENEWSTPSGQLTSDLSPLPPRAFDRPIAEFRVYAERWSGRLAAAVTALQAGLATGDRSNAERDWDTAFSDYLHLGAVYGLLPTGIERRLAGVPQELGETHFAGLHRIEMGLWTGAPVRSLTPVAHALGRTVAQERRVLPHVAITPLDYATRTHEILEDAQRDLLSGTQVPWSQAGVLGTAAGLAATRELVSTLVPLLQGRDNTLGLVQNWLVRLGGVLDGLRRRNGSWPSNGQLGMLARERLNGTMAGALSALELVPGSLETAPIPVTPSIPRSGR